MLENILHIIIHTILDTLKLFPFLFIAFLLIELIEHKFSKKTIRIVEKSGRLGPLLGGILGCFPQCGFSVLATNLYVTRIITLGTLISIYLSTSDEMLPILISRGSSLKTISTILLIKLSVGVISGFIIDFLTSKKQKINIKDLCEEEECHCEKGIIKSTITHTLNTLLFILLASFFINIIMHFGGEEFLSNLFNKNSLFTPFIASLIGLIPNCGSSIVITELYISKVLPLSAVISGLLTGSGVEILVLFKSNKNLEENIKILSIVYLIGVLSGLLIELINFIM